MWLVVGLGNPGRDYALNRHNAGFRAVEAIAGRFGAEAWKKSKASALWTDVRVGAHRLLLLEPQTYMNLSGQAVGEVVRFHKIPLERVIVFHDDLDLAPGRVRVKTGGGHGGHNGLRSLDSAIGQDYRRVRIGIGHPGLKELVHGYVLHDFSTEDREWLAPLLERMAEHLPLLLEGKDADYVRKIQPSAPTAIRAPKG